MNVHGFKRAAHDEESPSGSSGGDNGDVRERLARLETHMEHVATKQDVQNVMTKIEEADKNAERRIANIKIWVLARVIAAVPVCMGLILVFGHFLLRIATP